MIEIDASRVLSLGPLLERAAKQLAPELLERALQRSLAVVQAAVMKTTNERLTKDPTGALMRSWEVDVEPGGQGGSVRSGLPYAEIHDRGGIVYPRGKYLAIPLRPPMRRSERGLWPRHDRTPMRAWRSRRGNLLLWDVSRAKPVPRYLLLKQVTIPATRYISDAVESSMGEAAQVYFETISAALDAAGEQN